MKENYQKQLDALLAALPPEGKPRLLLQSCCGPCSSYVLEYLTRYFRVTVLYYNPNIQPRDEYDRRLYWQRELIRQLPTPEPVDLLACDYDGQRRARTGSTFSARRSPSRRTRTRSGSTPSARSWRSNTACAGCRRTSKSARAISAASSCPNSTASTGRNTAAVCTANRLTTRRRGSKIAAVTIHHAQVPYPCAHNVCNEKNGRN